MLILTFPFFFIIVQPGRPQYLQENISSTEYNIKLQVSKGVTEFCDIEDNYCKTTILTVNLTFNIYIILTLPKNTKVNILTINYHKIINNFNISVNYRVKLHYVYTWFYMEMV